MAHPTVCYNCQSQYEEQMRFRCECGEPVWFDEAAGEFDWHTDERKPGLWRYHELLPVSVPDGIARTAGGTPLVRARRLDEIAGCRVFVKDEGQNPTGSYKDRGSAVAIPQALQQGNDVVGTVSYGNMAMSTAAHAASLGRECILLVPTTIQSGRLKLIAQYDPTILQVDGEYSKLYSDALELSRESPVSFLLSDAPGRISGYKTALFEIFDSLHPDTPDAIVLPTSSGGFASGLWRGMLDLQAAGTVDEPPRLYLVQTESSDPITRAYTSGQDEVTALHSHEIEETIAHSIGNPDPPSGNRALTAVRETGGAVVSVSDDKISDAKQQFAQYSGLCVEPAAATPLAGVAQLTDTGEITQDETVILLPTGTGFKEMGRSETDTQTETIDRSALSTHLEPLFRDD